MENNNKQFKKISEEVITKINLLPPETLAANGVIRQVPNKSDEYICPFCNNGGNGNRDATGIKPHITASHVGWKCHRCDEKFDNMKIFALHYGISYQHDFTTLVEKICDNFNIAIQFDAPLITSEKKSDVAPAELNLINSDLQTDTSALKNFVDNSAGAWRGLPFRILDKFGCRFIENWTPPKSRAAQKFSTPTPRVLIPACRAGLTANYLARLTIPLASFPENERRYITEKAHAGKKTLFNFDALTSKEPVFVVEGYIDAMSIDFAGYPCVALGGADAYQLLVDTVKSLKKKPCVIILFDPDNTGRKIAPKVKIALAKIGCRSAIRFLSETESKTDANSILQEQGVDYLMNELFAIKQSAQVEFSAPEEKISVDEKISPAKIEEPAVMKLSFEQKKFLYSGDLSDYDFSRRIDFMYHDQIRYLQDENSWLLLERNDFNGGIWKNRGEKKSIIAPFAQQLSDILINNAEPKVKRKDNENITQEIADKERLRKYQLALGNHLKKQKNVSQAIEMMKGISSIIIHPEDLNRHKNLLNVLNGVIDLQTGKLYPISTTYLITNQAGAIFDPNADTTFIEKFFADIIPDLETRLAVYRYLGYGLTGEKNYHISEFWRGGGANGKSTAIDLITKLFGSYSTKLPAAGLLENRRPVDGNSATPAIAQLDGDIRLAIIDELPRNSRLDSALFKTLTGDETVYSRALYCNPRTIELRAKFIINGNHLPTFDVDDGGMQRRINNVAFTQIFKGDRADSLLPQKLSTPENLSAFLKILVAEAINFYRDGLLESDEMKAAKEEYFAESDFVRNFILDNCEVGNGGEISRKAFEEKLSKAYPTECYRLKKKELLDQIISRLEPLGASYSKTHGNKNVFKNIHWLDSSDSSI